MKKATVVSQKSSSKGVRTVDRTALALVAFVFCTWITLTLFVAGVVYQASLSGMVLQLLLLFKGVFVQWGIVFIGGIVACTLILRKQVYARHVSIAYGALTLFLTSIVLVGSLRAGTFGIVSVGGVLLLQLFAEIALLAYLIHSIRSTSFSA